MPDKRRSHTGKGKSRLAGAVLAGLALIALGGCATSSGTATESRILSDLRPYTAASPDLTLRAAAFASLEGLPRAEGVTAMQKDRAECSGSRCAWTADFDPSLIEIGPAEVRPPRVVTRTSSVTVLSDRFDTEDDLSATADQDRRSFGVTAPIQGTADENTFIER